MLAVGTTVKVFGKHLVKVVAVSKNGKRALVEGASYSGWTTAKNLAEVT